MPEHIFQLYESANAVNHDGQVIEPGQSYGPVDACEMKRFLQSYDQANPGLPIEENSPDWIQSLDDECPVLNNPITPRPAPDVAPSESNPGSEGDSGPLQGAPTPPVGGSVGGADPNISRDENVSPDDEPRDPPAGEPDPSLSSEQPQQQVNAGDPVDIFNGALYLNEIDIQVPNTIMPLLFSRVYRSGVARYCPFGWNWDHNHNLYIRELNNGDIALWRNLHEDIFSFDGTEYDPPRGVFEKLIRVIGAADKYEIIGKHGVTMHFEKPAGWLKSEYIPILWIQDRHGNRLLYAYDSEDHLAKVKDDDGHFLKFSYDTCGLLVAVEDQGGRTYKYEHDEQTFQLISMTSPSTSDYPDGIRKFYHYEKPFALPKLRHNILRIEDSLGQVYLETRYDQDPASTSYARVTEQLYGGYLFQFKYTILQWVPSDPQYVNIPYLRVEVMNPDFGLETYTFNYRGDLLDHRWRLNKDNSYRVVSWQYEFDSQGNLKSVVKPDGGSTILTYDDTNADPRCRNNLLQKELTAAIGFPAPGRIIWQGNYDPNYQLLLREENERGAITRYIYDFELTPASPTNSGKLKQIIYPDATLPDGVLQKCKAQFEYNQRGQITSNIAPDGTREEILYGNTGSSKGRQILNQIDPGGLSIQNKLAYDAFGNINETIDGNGNSSHLVYNALGFVEEITRPAVNGVTATTHFNYSSDGYIISIRKPKGSLSGLPDSHIINNTQRDVLGYPTEIVLSANTDEPRIFSVCNDYRGNPVKINNPDSSTISRVIDERGLLVKESREGVDGEMIFMKKVYDRTGRLVQETDQNGLKTIYSFDGFGRLSKIQLPNGSELSKKWGKEDLLEEESVFGDDGHGNTRLLKKTLFHYDQKGRKVKVIHNSFENDPTISVDVIQTYFHDNMDRRSRIVDQRGGKHQFFYDRAGRNIKEIDPEGNELRYEYDNNGNVIKIEARHKEPSGSVSKLVKSIAYDERNREIRVTEPDGDFSSTKWDDRDLKIEIKNQLSVVKKKSYNSFGECMAEVHDATATSITNEWVFDRMGRIKFFKDPSGQLSKYEYDTLGRLKKIEKPNGYVSERIYSDRGLITREELGSGAIFEFDYDSANRLRGIRNPANPPQIISIPDHHFVYDGLDRVVQADNGLNVQRSYDSLGRIISETTNGDAIQCSYNDLTGDVTKTWPDGRSEKYVHNLNGILSEVWQTSSGNLGSGNGLLVKIKASGPNRFGEAIYKSNFTESARYDTRKRLVEIAIGGSGTINENVKYRYDSGNRRRVEAIIGTKSTVNLHDYDAVNRLVESNYAIVSAVPDAFTQAQSNLAIQAVQMNSPTASLSESFEYNESDERVKLKVTGNPDKNYTYMPGHRINNDGTNAYLYYPDGSLLTNSEIDFGVDALGRVVRIDQGGTNLVKIEFDAFGRPGKLEEKGEPILTFNYLGNFIEQENENNVPVKQYTLQPGTGVPMVYHSIGISNFMLFDGRFNLIAVADEHGVLLESYRYRAYGKPEIFDAVGLKISNSSLGIDPIFGGQRYLSSVGLYLSMRRLMDPVNGTYASQDPMGYADSPSMYVYAAQNPIDNIDPQGEIIPFIVGAFVIAGALAGVGYSVYDAYHHPDRYEGWQGGLRVFGNVVAGAAIGGVAIIAGEAILGMGGVGIFASGSGTTATSLTATQTFVLYGTSTATTGAVGRYGFNSLFPEYVDPVSVETVTTDYIVGGGIPVIGAAFRPVGGYLSEKIINPIASGTREIVTRSIRGNWRPFGNTWTLLRKGYSSSSRLDYSLSRIFWNDRAFSSVSRQYWRQSGGANGKALHHWLFQNQSTWVPQGIRSAGFNHLEIPGSLNSWMGGRTARELGFRGIVTSLLAGIGYGSYQGTTAAIDWLNSDTNAPEEDNGRPQNSYERTGKGKDSK